MKKSALAALGCALLAAGGAHGSPPIAVPAAKPAVTAMAQSTAHELKAQKVNAQKKAVHMLALQKKAETDQKAETDPVSALSGGLPEIGGAIGGLGVMPKTGTEGTLQDPKLAMANVFAQLFAIVFVVFIMGCCCTQRGCLIYDKFIDKEPYVAVAEEEGEKKPA
jgi:hypothetical protein